MNMTELETMLFEITQHADAIRSIIRRNMFGEVESNNKTPKITNHQIRIQTNEFWSTSEVAVFLGVNEWTIRKWDKEGKLKSHRTPGGHRRWFAGDVVEFKVDLHTL